MGLDAFVLCNCYREGKTKEPPFDANLLILDSEGYYNLSVPYDKNEDLWGDFYSWISTCCPHEGMHRANERVGSWAMIRYFQKAMAKIGEEYFPIFQEYIPHGNGGILPTEHAKEALAELELFRSKISDYSNAVLKNAEVGNELYRYIEAYGGIFFLGADKKNCGVDNQGFFIFDGIEKREIFRSMHFILRRNDSGQASVCEYIDLDTNKRAVINWSIEENRTEGEYLVELYNLTAENFSFTTNALTTLLKASIETGNPIVWY